jgi:hypothetical protein
MELLVDAIRVTKCLLELGKERGRSHQSVVKTAGNGKGETGNGTAENGKREAARRKGQAKRDPTV